jgi:hypothetical protein
MELSDQVRVLLARIHAVEVQLIALGQRVDQTEERTINHESRIEDLENQVENDSYVVG